MVQSHRRQDKKNQKVNNHYQDESTISLIEA